MYAQFIEMVPEAMVVTDEAGFVCFVNTAFEQLFGYEHGALGGVPLAQLIPRVHQAPRGFALRSDGVSFEVDLSVGASSPGGRAMLTVIVRPVIAQAAARHEAREQLLHADRLASLGTLAAGMAHELNNALSPVMTDLFLVSEQLERLAQRSAPAVALAVGEVQVLVRDARVAADQVREVARDFRAFSRREDTRLEPVDVRRVVETSLRMAGTELRERAEVVTEFGEVPPVEATAARLGQVFLNLLVNAAQAIAPGNVASNEIRVGVCTDDRGRAVIEIRDTGSGIAPEHLSRLFVPFFTTKQASDGTGLGLSICARIVSELRGELQVESTLGRGTTFRVLLPPSARAPCAGPEPLTPAAVPRRRGRVLIIDDDQLVLNALRLSLGDAHDVAVSNLPTEALGGLSRGLRFDVILCDLMMPHMSGIDFHRAVMGLSPEQAARIVFVTGGASSDRARAFLEAVPNAKVEKPFEPAELVRLISALVP